MSYAQAFDKIKKKLAKADTKGMDSDFAVQITLSDEDSAGTLYVAYINGEFSVEPYDYRDNNVAIDIKAADLIKMAEGKLTKEVALEKGILKTFGDADVLDKITGIVKPVTRKTAAKKETVKKETAKKETVKKATEKKAPAKKTTAEKKDTKKTETKTGSKK